MKWVWIPLCWLALALFDATRTVGAMQSMGMHHNWPLVFAIEALSCLPWVVSTFFIIWLAQRMRSAASALARSAHLVTALCANAFFAGWTTLLVVTFRPFGPDFPAQALPHFLNGFTNDLPTTIVAYSLILTMNDFFDSRERLTRQSIELAQLKEQLAQAQLSALRRQIEPHFLFNALNAIAGLIRGNESSDAITKLVSLSDFLRRTVSESNRQEVPLAEELEFVKQYLATQKVRFAERLQLSVDVSMELQHARVPDLILQPLVESAVSRMFALDSRRSMAMQRHS